MQQLLPPEVKEIANLGAVALIFMLAVKWFFEYLGKKPDRPDTPHFKANGNGRAGEKSSEWWELTFARIMRQCLDDHQTKVQRPAAEEAQETREQILDRLQQLERQVALAVAEITRQIRDK